MSGKERLSIVFGMWEFALSLAKASERSLHPELSEEEIEKRARERLAGGTTGSH
jgi:hypothetical protein